MRGWITAALCAGLLAPGAAHGELPRRPQQLVVEHTPPGEAPTQGPRLAPVTLELYVQLDDRSLRAAFPLLLALADRHPRRLRVVYHIVAARGRTYLAEAALEAAEQGLFDPFIRAIFEPRSPPRREDLAEIAERIGMDHDLLTAAWEDRRHVEALDRNDNYRRRRNVRRAAEALFNGRAPDKSVVEMTIDELALAYDEAYQRARAALARGVPLEDLHDELVRQIEEARPPLTITAGMVDGGDPAELPASRDPARPPLLVGGRVDTSGPHVTGNEDAPVVLVLYCSLQSLHCRSYSRVIDDVARAYAGEVRLVFKHLFDESDAGQSAARLLHEGALCAEDEGDFWGFYQEIYRRGPRRTPSLGEWESIAQRAGLDPERFTACLRSGRFAEALDRHLEQARQVGVRVTPTLVINGQLYTGTKSFQELRSLVEDELSPGLLERWFPRWRLAPSRYP